MMCEEEYSNLDLELYLKDWEMTKDRIKHFDNVIMRIRIQAIPISTAFLTVGWGLNETKATWTPLIFLFACVYIIPVAMFDWLHYKLLRISVEHARDIENMAPFKGKMQITRKLTKKTLTRVHNIAIAIVYILVFVAGFLSYLISTGVISISV